MQKFHPLTEKLWTIATKEKFDRVLRTELKQMAKELFKQRECDNGDEKVIAFGLAMYEEILGLSTESEPEKVKHYHYDGSKSDDIKECYDAGCVSNPKTKTAEACSCVMLNTTYDALKNEMGQWKYCHVCGTPRPTEKTLAEDSTIKELRRQLHELCYRVLALEEHYEGKKHE